MKKLHWMLLLGIAFVTPVSLLAQDSVPLQAEFDAMKKGAETAEQTLPEQKGVLPVAEKPVEAPAVAQLVMDKEAAQPADKPNLGRNAKPLSELVLTPPPLPGITINLGDKKAEEPAPQPEPQPVVKKEPSRPIDITPKEVKPTVEIVKQPEPVKEKPAPKQMPKNLDELFGQSADVTKMNISGFMLGMTPDEIVQTARAEKWKVIKQKEDMPLFRDAFYNEKCREKQIHIVEQINDCKVRMAKNDQVYYTSELTVESPNKSEVVLVLFSSHATGNKAYKIYYQSRGDNSLGFTQKNLEAKQRRKDMFWNKVFEAYGYPDDAEQIIWGDITKTYMKASMSGSSYDGFLVMEDKAIQDTDYFAAEDAAKTLPYTDPFTFMQKSAEPVVEIVEDDAEDWDI